jgi:hypothetical protein
VNQVRTRPKIGTLLSPAHHHAGAPVVICLTPAHQHGGAPAVREAAIFSSPWIAFFSFRKIKENDRIFKKENLSKM